MEASNHTTRPYQQSLLQSIRGWNAHQNIQNAGMPRPMGGADPLAVELRQCARHCTRGYSCQERCLTLNYRRRDSANMSMHPARKNCTNPAFSLPTRRPKYRSKHKPPSPSRAHHASHVIRRTGLRPHQGTTSGGKQRPSRLRTMTMADIEEDTHVEGQVPEEVTRLYHNVLQASDANGQRVSADSLEKSTTESMEPGLMDSHERRGDEVG